MGAKSHRSTLTLFHQWPHHHPSSGSSSSSPTSPTTPVSHAKQHHTQHPRLDTVITPGTPDSPSQLDPFNNNSTHPCPLISLPSIPSSRTSYCPTSTSASLTSRTGRQVSRPGSEVSPSPSSPSSTTTAPKIILASPSTSTIHYLFPSETRSNLTADRLTRAVEGKAKRTGSVRRSHSAVGDRERERLEKTRRSSGQAHRENNRTPNHLPPGPDSDTPPLELAVEGKIAERTFHPPPSRSCDSVKHLSTGTLGTSLGSPAKTATNPLGPAKRVVSGSGGRTSTTSSSTTAPVKKSDISGPISVDPKSPAKSYGPMRTLRRQPSMADLSRGTARGLQVEVEQGEVEVEHGDARFAKSSSMGRAGGSSMGRKGEKVLSESWGNRRYDDGQVSPGTQTLPTGRVIKVTTMEAPSPTYRELRRRSKSLTSPRLSPSSGQSPVLPAPDFGNPLTLSDVIPSPSFSHLDYSTAGSSSGLSRRGSNAVGLFTKHASAIFPSSVPMERGITRRGLGSYDSGKIKAREDAEKRLNGEGAGIARRMSQLGRTVSLRRKHESSRPRPRSQSLSNRSVREMGISPPVPPRHPNRDSPRRPSDPARGIYLGDLSVDLGGRFHSDDPAAKTFYPNSPLSTDTTHYPRTSPLSGFVSLSPIDRMDNDLTELRVMGRPLHPAFAGNASEISLLAPSTIGLGFSPIGTPVSLPSSLEAEAIDVTETGRRLSALSTPAPWPSASEDTPSGLQAVPAASTGDSVSTRNETSNANRAALLSQNTYYIPPVHPKPALRSSRSSGSGVMRHAFAFGNLAVDERTSPSTASGKGLAKSPSLISKRSRNELRDSVSTARAKRPTTAFSLCSPPSAIDPLPPVNHTSPVAHAPGVPGTEPARLRSKPSSPFLTASASLRIFFGREGFVARSLSGAFDRDLRIEVEESSLKSRISAPIGVGGRDGTVSKKGNYSSGQAAEKSAGKSQEELQERDQAWRRDVLSQAVSLSISSSLNRLSNLAENGSEPKMVASSSKPRLGIPVELLAAGQQQPLSTTRRSDVRRTSERSRTHGAEGRAEVPEVKVDGLSPGRTVVQVGRDDGMASASSYSNYAPTAKESPRSPRSSPNSPVPAQLTPRWSLSPGKKPKKARSQPSKPTISSPLPLFTPAHPSRLGLSALEPITSPLTTTPTPSPAPTIIEGDQAASGTPRSHPAPAMHKVTSGTKSRLMSIMRRHPEAPNRRTADVDPDRLTSPPPPPSLTSPSSFSLSLLRSPKSVHSSGGIRLDATVRGISSEEVRKGELEIGSMGHGVTSEQAETNADGVRAVVGDEIAPRGVLDELVARDEEGSDKARAKEEKLRKVLTWRRAVGPGVEDEEDRRGR